MKAARSFICLPDISGFTKFTRQTDISHSKHIISELLEVILHSNNLDLKVAEIEGDAVFFYRKDFTPSAEQLVDQVKIMFLNFHAHLKYYEQYRICHCGACSTATQLGLKFIIHLGFFTFTTVDKIRKPYGPDVILAHKLLKNNIEESEYMLLSENTFDTYFDRDQAFVRDMKQLIEGSSDYDDLDTIKYRYFLLDHLHERVKELPTEVHPLKYKNPLRYQGIVNAPKEKVYEIASNLDYRENINKDASDFKYEKDRVNRTGFVHQCVINNRNVSIETVSNDFGEDKLVYGELVSEVAIAKKMYTYTILKNHEKGTKVYYEVHLDSIPVITWLAGIFFRPVLRSRLKKSFKLLKEYCEQTE